MAPCVHSFLMPVLCQAWSPYWTSLNREPRKAPSPQDLLDDSVNWPTTFVCLTYRTSTEPHGCLAGPIVGAHSGRTHHGPGPSPSACLSVRPGFESVSNFLHLCHRGQVAQLLQASVCPSVNGAGPRTFPIRSSGVVFIQSAPAHADEFGLFALPSTAAGSSLAGSAYVCFVAISLQCHFQDCLKTSKRPSRNISAAQPGTVVPQELAFPTL